MSQSLAGTWAFALDPDDRGLDEAWQRRTWFESRRLALLFEAQVAGGSLLVCAMDLRSDLDQRLVARQLRHSLLRYMEGQQFAPRQGLSVADLQGLLLP
jgi:hypothetical protein